MDAFNTLKHKMTQAPVLALPDFSLSFILETVACAYGIGVVLMQEGRPLSFFSKTIGPKAAAMSTYDEEVMAIIKVLEHWKHYFAASSLIIRTDQRSLKYIQDQKLTEGIQHKLLIKLLDYNFNVEYKQGKNNKVVDALSRVKYRLHSLVASQAKPAWISEVISSYAQDQRCKDLLSQLATSGTALPNYVLQ